MASVNPEYTWDEIFEFAQLGGKYGKSTRKDALNDARLHLIFCLEQNGYECTKGEVSNALSEFRDSSIISEDEHKRVRFLIVIRNAYTYNKANKNDFTEEEILRALTNVKKFCDEYAHPEENKISGNLARGIDHTEYRNNLIMSESKRNDQLQRHLAKDFEIRCAQVRCSLDIANIILCFDNSNSYIPAQKWKELEDKEKEIKIKESIQQELADKKKRLEIQNNFIANIYSAKYSHELLQIKRQHQSEPAITQGLWAKFNERENILEANEENVRYASKRKAIFEKVGSIFYHILVAPFFYLVGKLIMLAATLAAIYGVIKLAMWILDGLVFWITGIP